MDDAEYVAYRLGGSRTAAGDGRSRTVKSREKRHIYVLGLTASG